ncbi:MAG: FCD domain-containing protein [Caulobacterales bacterium]
MSGQIKNRSRSPSEDVASFAPIRIRKTAEVVADEIRKMILSGRLKEGDALQPEAQIIADFNVSRPSVREAFRILESEKLISISRGSRGGAKVHAPNADLVARYAGFVLQAQNVRYSDVYQARLIVEPPGARMAAERASKEAPSVLRAKNEELRAAGDTIALSRAIASFHTTLMEFSGNRTLILLASVLEGIVVRHQIRVNQSKKENRNGAASDSKGVVAAYKSQEKLIAMIQAGDGPGAEMQWRRHMEVAGKTWASGDAGDALVTWSD